MTVRPVSRARDTLLGALAIVATVAAAPARLAAQDSTCDFRTCALWLDRHTVRQGAQGTSISHGDNVPRVDELATEAEPIRRHYVTAQRRYRLATALDVATILAAIGWGATYPNKDQTEWKPIGRVWMPAAAAVAFVAARQTHDSGEDHLRQAIWLYNRTLPNAAAGPQACSYDRCALRVRPRFLSTRIVQGMEGRPVARIGLAAPRLPLLDAAADSARAEFEAFRRAHRVASTTGGIYALSEFGAAALLYHSRAMWSRHTAGALFVGGYLVGHLAAPAWEEQHHLDRALWLYNASLATTR